jgi:hypothetical protein
MTLPPRVRAEVQRIADREARRLLAETIDAEPARDPVRDSILQGFAEVMEKRHPGTRWVPVGEEAAGT